MISGLLITLAHKPLDIANDVGFVSKKEGRVFPPSPKTKPKTMIGLTGWAQRLSIALTIIGGALFCLGNATWSRDPKGWLHVKTAGIHFMLPVGASL